MAIYRATGATVAFTPAAAATDGVNKVDNVTFCADNDLTTAAVAHGQVAVGSQGHISLPLVTHVITFSIGPFSGIPSNGNPARVYARIRLQSGVPEQGSPIIGSFAPDRQGSCTLDVVTPAGTFAAKRVWNTTTGNIDVSEDLICAQKADGTALLTNDLAPASVRVYVTLTLIAPTIIGNNTAQLTLYEVWVADDIITTSNPYTFGMLL